MQGRLKLRFVNKISFCELFLLQKQKFTFSTAGWYYLACIWFVNKSLTFPYQCSYIYSNFFNYNCKLGHLIVNGFVMNKSMFIQSVYLYWKKTKRFQQKLQILNKTQKAVLCCKLHVTAISNIKLLWTVLKAIDYQSFKLIDKLTKSTFNEFR